MPKIEFVVAKDGTTKLEVSGAEGVTCDALTQVFEDAIGVVTEVNKKPEYFLDHLSTDVQVFSHE